MPLIEESEMRLLLTQCARSVWVIALLFVLSSSLFSQSNGDDVLNRAVTLQTDNATFVYVLGKLAEDWGVPIGLEKSLKHSDVPKITIDVKSATLKDVLDLITRQESTYAWQCVDGVIIFTPIKDRSTFLSSFLDLRFGQISYPKGKESDPYSLKKAILDLPEVAQLMHSAGVRDAGLLYSTPSKGSVLTKSIQTLSRSNLTIREYLNFVITNSQRKTWVVDMVGDQNDRLLVGL